MLGAGVGIGETVTGAHLHSGLPVQRARRSAARLGLYLHVPFCQSICNYCNFARGLLDESLKNRYVSALEREIEMAADGSVVDTLYFGGGTPSLLSAGELERLIRACGEAFAVDRGAEVTVEVNPETTSIERFMGYRAVGVNRLSMGVQSFRDEELEGVGRLHSAERARQAVDQSRRAGFDNISLDLMIGLPEQTPATWRDSIESLLDVAPEHVSFYLLELYPDAPLRDALLRERRSLPSDDAAADMYADGLQWLDEAGYEQYEISNSARPARRSRHNLKYWTDGEWLGLGPAAHSTRDGVRWQNVGSAADYVERVEQGLPITAERVALSAGQQLGDALITGLRLVEGVSVGAFHDRYAVDLWARYGLALAPFVDEGLLVWESDRLRLTRP